ncbi:tRNA (guanosine(37)-N1)-methyltransferase TrmD [Ketobacter sp. MCCC 1A13808]|uniref:tRNA (guanosine(37)-N1)-methyltransferase TrmD n=1 Tax=Ketobacter sp. MCCC 1A13808 TaxID=2602738 RepID=UPI0012EBC650|nr:tRNA (guanosine(37)-N1)-methyltransferase TrmD [Ketobacter sp. MCCC 1A13808]MVF14170.1 tRNA (guanosine(37)-N1)-methyltransferase TrmD [Ketobacter sp. MCCC 1A13808]
MKFGIVTLFPEMFGAITEHGVTGRAIKNQIVQMQYVNPREFAGDVHRTVDSRPYGGGPGMLMLANPLLQAIDAAKAGLKCSDAPRVVYVSPQGKPFDQAAAQEFSQRQAIVFVCGRYEGIDERVIDIAVDEEWSLGDFVVSGGELPVMAMIDATVRLIPGVLGHKDSAAEDSFFQGLLDCPHYTRPEHFAGRDVPEVLLSGNHALIKRWRLKQALGRTWQRRPDLLERRELSKDERKMLEEFIQELAPST